MNMIKDSPFAMYTCDGDGRITFYNVAAAELWGREPDPDKDFWSGALKMYDSAGREIAAGGTAVLPTIQSGIASDSEHISIARPDGQVRHLKMYIRPLPGQAGETPGAFITLLDVTENYDYDRRNALLSAIVESSDDAIISKDLDGTIRSWNHGAERVFGYTEQEAVGKSITMLIPRNRLTEEDQILSSIRKGEKIDHFETQRVRRDGQQIPISLTVSPIKNRRGEIVGASKVARDISDRQDAASKQAMLAAIVESSDDAIISKRLDGTITSWNAGAQRIFGYSEAETVGKSITILIPESRLHEEEHIIDNIKNGRRVDHFQTIRLHKAGYEIPISLTVSPIRDLKGQIIGASKVARDVTEQVRSQDLLKRYAENMEMLNSIGKSISEKLDIQTILQRVTDATKKITGATFGAFLYNTMNEEGESLSLYALSGTAAAPGPVLAAADKAFFQQMFSEPVSVRLDNLGSHPEYSRQMPELAFAGMELKPASLLTVPVVSGSGQLIGGLIFGHPEPAVFTADHEDIVGSIASQAAVAIERSRLFEELQLLSEKKDEFVALASHELKTPLTSIKGYLQVLARNHAGQADSLFLNKCLSQVEKLNSLIADMLDMSKIEAGKLVFNLEELDIRALLADVIDTFRHTSQSHEIIASIPDGPVVIQADRQRMEQALVNLVGNAIKYSPNAQSIRVMLEENAEQVAFHIEDQGIGLSPDEQKKIFSRFYRSEQATRFSGLGLGLYLTKQIIDRHHGELTVRSEQGKGSVFSFSLPREQPVALPVTEWGADLNDRLLAGSH
ncbi:histidine kinase [Pedobacter yulinensis]|uniref:histidine kinase n=1 Tax=Pedobacter yulinensis TaxID=2126353 RepID=A0A2T3HK11_9SPHI|nr:PAS domain S-box protein [Pedobacter yulinensis]PST82721.1 histidine kinase [Pedobacter yulinensis]